MKTNQRRHTLSECLSILHSFVVAHVNDVDFHAKSARIIKRSKDIQRAIKTARNQFPRMLEQMGYWKRERARGETE